VNALDLIILAAMVGAGYAGYRLGFVARAVSWIGLVIGLVVAVAVVDDLVNALADEPAATRLVAALAFVVILGTTGQLVGFVVSAAIAERMPPRPAIPRGDRIAGAVTGVLGVFVVVWLLSPALTSAPGWTARAARSSSIVRFVDRVGPDPPPGSEALGRLVAEAPFPEVFEPFEGPGDIGSVPVTTLPASVVARVAPAVVKVEGQACDQIQNGSGYVLAEEVVLTNAHVVAGESATVVQTEDGRELGARVVAFDPMQDLAALAVPGLDLQPLPEGSGERGTTGAVFGHPQGGVLRQAPARVDAVSPAQGRDIYGDQVTRRLVFVLAAALEPGDSGAPFVDRQGRVIGIAFAIQAGRDDVAYALTDAEIEPFVDTADLDGPAVPTGDCLRR
jgi:S1-C subfamily serine protease